MKRKRTVAALFVFAAAFLCFVSAQFFCTAEERSASFAYEHDPRLNPRAMRDIVVDPGAVYGFSPDPEGTLAPYAKYDWSDPEALVEYRQSRLDYFASYARMYDLLDAMTAEGKSVEEIARAVSAKRNELRLASYDDDPDGLATLKERNLQRYGHEDGPQADELFAQYGSWTVVLEKAFSHNAGMDACVGLYDDYYDYYIAFGYIEDEAEAKASREYTAALFCEAAGLSGELTQNTFSDADKVSAWYAESVKKAVSAGVLKGYEDGTARPQEAVRRVEALVMLARCLPEQPALGEAAAFADCPDWAKAEIERLAGAGLVESRKDGLLGADDALTVKEVKALCAWIGKRGA